MVDPNSIVDPIPMVDLVPIVDPIPMVDSMTMVDPIPLYAIPNAVCHCLCRRFIEPFPIV